MLPLEQDQFDLLPKELHLARVCQSKNKLEMPKKTSSGKSQGMYQLQEQSDDSSGGSTEEFLHSVFQLGNTCHKFIITVFINGIGVDMEVDSGAERSTIPWAIRISRQTLQCL